ncbi:hypothetical protein [Spiroplasma taiwanense]|uniref:Uncharacterized protein n=1 Tax=Spiroplasma taiwanense CT-1 TaxID=1276220 RepID=S5MIG9_9MOLU|nr:hypothetical protein [Spiroplasma taiwanense]AGR41690.1 hypothetical protein STAIW_v1c11070 [Spiroplasma taiwanense CT-1]
MEIKVSETQIIAPNIKRVARDVYFKQNHVNLYEKVKEIKKYYKENNQDNNPKSIKIKRK